MNLTLKYSVVQPSNTTIATFFRPVSSHLQAVDCVSNVTAHGQGTDFFFQLNWLLHLNWWGGRWGKFSRPLTVEECGSAGSDCIVFSKYVDHSLKMSLQGVKKRVKRNGEREVVYNVYKFMKNESELGITIPLAQAQKRFPEATRVSRRTSCRLLRKGENM